MTKLGPAPRQSAMPPIAGGMMIAANRFMVCRSHFPAAPDLFDGIERSQLVIAIAVRLPHHNGVPPSGRGA
jgi:hypothetical protein